MAARTASVTGNWADTATWGGSSAPVAGDTVVINTGITVTVAASTTAEYGTSPTSATAAVATDGMEIQGTGQLIIAGTLNAKGPYDIVGGGVVTVQDNGILNIDSSASSTSEYRLRHGTTGTGRLVMEAGSTITSPVGFSWYQSSPSVQNTGQLDINGVEGNRVLFQRMKNSGSAVGWSSGLNITSAGKFEASHCTFDETDDFSFTGSGTFTIRWEWCRWQNTTAPQNLVLNTSTVTKEIYNCTFDKNPNSSGGWGTNAAIDPSECYFDAQYTASGTGGYATGRWNIKRSGTSTQGQPNPFYPASGGTLLSNEILWKDIAYGNPQWGTVNNALSGARTIRGLVFISEGTAQDGDCSSPDSSDAVLTTYQDCLFVPNSNGGQPGTWCSQLGGGATPAHTVAFNHNTGVIANDGGTRGIVLGETQDSQAGRLASLKSNLAFAGISDPSAQFLVYMDASQTTNDPMAAAQADHNWIDSANSNTAATVYTTGNGAATQATPTAANDIYSQAPNFIDKGRAMRAWAAWWGTRIGAVGDSEMTPGVDATAVNARLHLLQMHDGSLPVATANTAIQLCVQYIRRGYIPTNAAGRGLGHDSLTPGMFGAWAPALSAVTATSSGFSLTTNAADGTLYWVVTTSATAPDWDRIIAGQDHTGAALSAPYKGSTAVAGTSVSDSFGALANGTYYFHCAHRGAGTEAALDDYLRTSDEVSSSSFVVGAGGGVGGEGITRSVSRSITYPMTRKAA